MKLWTVWNEGEEQWRGCEGGWVVLKEIWRFFYSKR